MRLKIASRKSDLARWQAVKVAESIKARHPEAQIEHIFKSSFGDENLDLSLPALGGKGVFTEDFLADLAEGRCHMVVHSWKDLPVEMRAHSHIAMTLPRADLRDIWLVPESVWQDARRSGRLKILTSSPRRVHNLTLDLPGLIPAEVRIEFTPVRGNVPTRLRRMHELKAGLVLAKAGLDRLLEAERAGFMKDGDSVAALIKDCRFQVLPISVNPPAPAQGALAVEILNANHELSALCASLNHAGTARAAVRERDILKTYGGGCHQKIGVAVLERDFGTVISLRGLTDAGEVLNEWRVESQVPWKRAESEAAIFPRHPRENRWFEREPIEVDLSLLRSRPGLIVARAEAWPENYRPPGSQIIWTAGVMTWRRLAQAGHWVNGCFDGLGEQESPELTNLCGDVAFSKLTHQGAIRDGDLAAYRLKELNTAPDLSGKTHFFWMSISSFEQALKRFPQEIRAGLHSSGPGQTYQFLKNHPQIHSPVKVFANWEQFKRDTVP